MTSVITDQTNPGTVGDGSISGNMKHDSVKLASHSFIYLFSFATQRITGVVEKKKRKKLGQGLIRN